MYWYAKLYKNMKLEYIEEITFEKYDFKSILLKKGEYEDCRFLSCDFSNVDMSDCIFTDSELLTLSKRSKVYKSIYREMKMRYICALCNYYYRFFRKIPEWSVTG